MAEPPGGRIAWTVVLTTLTGLLLGWVGMTLLDHGSRIDRAEVQINVNTRRVDHLEEKVEKLQLEGARNAGLGG